MGTTDALIPGTVGTTTDRPAEARRSAVVVDILGRVTGPSSDAPSSGSQPAAGVGAPPGQHPPLTRPDAGSRWRCAQCGNLTRFDVVRTARVHEFWHFDLAGDPVVDEAEVVSEELAEVSCRWCGSTAVEVVARPSS